MDLSVFLPGDTPEDLFAYMIFILGMEMIHIGMHAHDKKYVKRGIVLVEGALFTVENSHSHKEA